MSETEDPPESLKEEIMKVLSTKSNGVNLVKALSTAITTYFVDVMGIESIEEIDLNNADELIEAAKEAWKEGTGSELPKLHLMRLKKWVGTTTEERVAVETSGKVVGSKPMATIAYDPPSVARKEIDELGEDLTEMEKVKFAKDMAEQGLTGKRLLLLALSLTLGKVSKLSECENLKYGVDPALSEAAKLVRKAGTKMLSKVISEKNVADATAYFSGLMQKYAAECHVEESARIANWWAETIGCFGNDKDLLFEYLAGYFDKYAGRGLPVLIDVVLVVRMRNSANKSGFTAEEGKALKTRLTEAEAAIAKLKSKSNEYDQQIKSLKDKVEKAKPTAEEQERRRSNVTCNNCGKKGHYASECPEKKVE